MTHSIDPFVGDDTVARLRFAMAELSRGAQLDKDKPMRTIRYNLYMSLHNELMERKRELSELKWERLTCTDGGY